MGTGLDAGRERGYLSDTVICPRCRDDGLQEVLGPKRTLVDLCKGCRGVWLDKGEVYVYSPDPGRLFEAFRDAYRGTAASHLLCPRCRVAMREARVDSVVFEACPACGGNWFDKGEVEGLTRLLVPDGRVLPSEAPKAKAELPRAWAAPAAKAAMAALPSLALRAGAVLALLYGALGAVLLIAVEAGGFPPEGALAGAGIFFCFQFLLGPWILDLSLTWMHSLSWTGVGGLPRPLGQFLTDACREKGIPLPRIGVIKDGNPNAFTYGRVPSDARLVVTTGLLEMLDDDEQAAVIGHELGHIAHYDMLVMTMAGLVPVILYAIYRMCTKSRGSSSKGKGQLAAIGVAAYLLYILTNYLVLALSRLRELHADRYGADLTGRPNALASALVKIAYGLAGRRGAEQGEEEKGEIAMGRLFGVFDPTSAKALAVAASRGGAISRENILGAMQWDLWNPWADVYEFNSTHPLPAKRIDHLGRQAAALGQEPFILFDLEKPESFFDEFLVDLFYGALPWTGAVLGLAGGAVAAYGPWWAWGLAGLSLGAAGRLRFAYPSGGWPEASAAALLKQVKVSAIRPIPTNLKGTVIGRGSPGFVLCEDIVLQDATGFVVLDYEQPLRLFDYFFALTQVKALIGQEVEVEGWYRRAPVPYIQVRRLRWPGGESICRTLELRWIGVGVGLAVAAWGFI